MSEKKEAKRDVKPETEVKKEKAPKAECGICALRVVREDPLKPTLVLVRSDNTEQIVRITPKYAADLLQVFEKSQRFDKIRVNFSDSVQLMQLA